MNDVKKYFKDLEEFESSPLFITDRTDQIKKEIEENFIMIGLNGNLAKSIKAADFTSFLSRVKANRKMQIRQTRMNISLIYYCWFDEPAGHLCFNFINSNHDKLPFGCKLEFVEKEEAILELFINSDTLDGISWDMLTDTTDPGPTDEEIKRKFTLKVYKELISPF